MTAAKSLVKNPLDFHIYAGVEALAHIQQQGLQRDDISMLLGASSGPKWLVLHGFDQYLLKTMQGREQALDLMGRQRVLGAWPATRSKILLLRYSV